MDTMNTNPPAVATRNGIFVAPSLALALEPSVAAFSDAPLSGDVSAVSAPVTPLTGKVASGLSDAVLVLVVVNGGAPDGTFSVE